MTALDEPAPSRADDGPSWVVDLLQFDRSDDTFTYRRPASPQGRLFGGMVAAQALGAAGTTVGPGPAAQSLHAYFVRGGRPGVDVDFEVERTRDGRSFATRRVTARQDGKVILELLASFHVSESGTDAHPPAPPTVAVADAEPIVEPAELTDRFEIRTPPRHGLPFIGPPYWIRTRAAVEDDQLLRACALTYMSDLGLMAAARPRGVPLRFEPGIAASLDHSIWFHRRFRPDRWHQYQAQLLNNSDARGLVVGSFHDQAGTLVASMTQEALWRL